MNIQTELMLLSGSSVCAVAVGVGLWRLGPIWDELATTQMGQLAKDAQRLSLNIDRLRLLLRLWGAAVIGTAVTFIFVLKMIPLAVVATGLVYVAPRLLLDYIIRRRENLLRDQLVGAATMLANSVRAGLSIAQGFEMIASEVPQPLSAELQRLVFQYRRGRPLAKALKDARLRLRLEAFTAFAVAIEATLERGGRVTEALERISHSLNENQRLERKIEADTASGRRVVVILAGFPAFFIGMFYFLDPQSVGHLFDGFVGQLAVSIVIALVYVGVRWASRIMKLEF